MKFLHTSDLHLNSKMSSKLEKTKAKERKLELLLNFKKMTETAERESCRAFIIAGDLFDTEKISESAKKSALDIIASKPEISFLYLPGNHEREAISGMAALPQNLLVFGKEWTYYEIDGVRFAGRCETEPGMFYKLDGKKSEKLVCILHGELADKSDYGGKIGFRELCGSGVDYLALGHFHSFEKEEFERGKYAVYSGTPLGRGFDETGEKGFVLAEINDDFVNFDFQKSEGRRLESIDVDVEDITGTHELSEKIKVATKDLSPAILLRVRLIGRKAPEVKFDLEFIKERLSPSFYYFEIKDKTRLKISKEDYLHTKSLKGEFIRLVLSDESLSLEEKEEIISVGISALMGESI